MKFAKVLTTVLLSATLLAACGEKNDSVIEKTNVENTNVKKHESVELPVTIYSDSDYGKSSGKNTLFQRNIESVAVEAFTEESQEIFLSKYDDVVRRQNFDLINDFKLLKLTLSHEVEGESNTKAREAFMLNSGSDLVIGDKKLSMESPFLQHQLEYVATEYRMGKTYDESGEIWLAVPKEMAIAHLQLNIKQKKDDVIDNIYIDLF